VGGSKMDNRATPPDEPKLGPRMPQVWPLVIAALIVGYFFPHSRQFFGKSNCFLQ